MSLLDTVLASPGDLGACAVYADWLITQDQPRGTFIAQQIEMARSSGLEASFPSLMASTDRLLARHASQWLAAHIEHLGLDRDLAHRTEISPTRNARWHNGFLAEIAMGEQDLQANFTRLAAVEPMQGPQLILGEGVETGSVPCAETWRSLTVRPNGWFTAHSLVEVLRWNLRAVVRLDLSGVDLGVAGARVLAGLDPELDTTDEAHAPPPFSEGQIRELHLQNCTLRDEGFVVLAGASTLALETLDLAQNRLEDLASLDRLRAFSELRSLGLSGNNALGPMLGTLSDSPVWRQLEHLRLPQTTTPAALSALFAEPSPVLQRLEVASAKELLTAPATLARASEAWLHLHLGSTRLGDAGLAALLEVPSTHTMLDLKLNQCSLSDRAIETLTERLARLVRLDVSSNKLTDASLHSLASWSGLPQLTHLRLRNNRKLTAAGYQALIDAPGFDPACLDVGKAPPGALEGLEQRFGTVLVSG